MMHRGKIEEAGMIQIMNATIPMDPDAYQGDVYEDYQDNKDHLQDNGFITNGHDDDGIIEENGHHDNGDIVVNGTNGHQLKNGNGDRGVDDSDELDQDFFNYDSMDGSQEETDANGFSVEFVKPGPRSRKRKMDRPLKVKLILPELPPQSNRESPEKKSSRPSRAHKLPERFTPEAEKQLTPGKKTKKNDLVTDIDDEVPSILARVLADGAPPSVRQMPQLQSEFVDDGELEVDQYTDQELDREIKRLRVRNLRAEIRRNQAQTKFYESSDRKFSQLLSVLLKSGLDTQKELVGIKNLLGQSLDIAQSADGSVTGHVTNGHGTNGLVE